MRILILAMLVSASAAADCPTAVTTAATKRFPDSTVTKCKAHKGEFEVKLVTKAGAKLELEILADGTIKEIEEPIAIADLPAAVSKAFAARYPKAKPTKAEKMTRTGKETHYEIAFGGKEATFSESGAFVEEE